VTYPNVAPEEMIYLDLWIEKWQYTICAEQLKSRQKKVRFQHYNAHGDGRQTLNKL